MKELIIIGAGGFGREVWMWAQQSVGYKTEWDLKGFIDDNITSLKNHGIDSPVVSKLLDYQPQANDLFIIAIGDVKTKMKIAQVLKEKNAEFTNIIHHSALISPNAILGKGIIICPYTIVSCQSEIKNFVTLNSHITIGHDTTIGEGTTVSGHCDITGNCKIGNHVFFGSTSCTRPGIIIEDGATIGLGSAVIKKVREGNTVMGVPAKKLL